MSWFVKLKLLLWKNVLLQKRHKYQTAFEIIAPVVFSLFLIAVRVIVSPEYKPALVFPPFPVSNYVMGSNAMAHVTKVKRNGTVAFSPDTPYLREVTKRAMKRIAVDRLGFLTLFINPFNMPEPTGYKDSKDMERHLIQPKAMDRYLAGIQYQDTMIGRQSWPNDITLTLRFPAVMRNPIIDHPYKASWKTNLLYPVFRPPGPREPHNHYGGYVPGYSYELFLAIQQAVSHEIIENKTGAQIKERMFLRRYPANAYQMDELLVALERFVSMILMMCFAYTFVSTVRVVTLEKELQLKEMMSIMGVPSWLHWLAWFLKQFSFLFFSISLMVIMFKIPFNRSKGGYAVAVFTHTPWTVLFFFMVLFVASSLSFAFLVTVFFRTANTAAAFMGLAWFSAYAIYMLTQVLYENLSFTSKILLSLISNTALGYAFQMMVICEGTGEGLQWNSFFKPITYQEKFLPGHVVLMLIFDSILYMIIAMYVEKIRPGSYGVPLPWYFPFTKEYWRPAAYKKAVLARSARSDAGYSAAMSNIVHDEEPKNVPVGVNIKNLTKIYESSKHNQKKAVDNLNLRIYEDEITVLLGHNAAGKTTTLSMLTGLIPPTSGSALINGYDIVTDTELARNSLGICPQHNVLFPELTVGEHIKFYSRLKGVPSKNIKDEVQHFVELLELVEKKDVEAKNLSGGQQRRLSVAAAMCGNPKVVLLDEPTSGLDPAARRSLWDFLLKEKKGRSMILSTHFMDEADLLGDRIAIMSGGKLQCYGTSYFLKKHYGIGYKMTVVKDEDCSVDEFNEFFRPYIPDIKENTNIGSELTYILPNQYVEKFPEMLKELESKKESLKFSSYGLTVTSLEEVFMKAGAEKKAVNDSETIIRSTEALQNLDSVRKVTGYRLLINHIRAMFFKLFYNTIRNKLSALLQFLIPVINISLSVIIAKSWQFLGELPALTLNLGSGFKKTETLVAGPNFPTTNLVGKAYKAYVDYFKGKESRGMKLIDLRSMEVPNYYLEKSKKELTRMQYETLVGATFSSQNITGWFSNYGFHDSAISLALVNNAILNGISPGSELKIINHPLPYSIEHLIKVMATSSSMGFQFAFNIAFCLAFVTAFLVIFPIKERLGGSKLIQSISGVRPIVFWGIAYIWDWCWLFLIYIAMIITLACYREQSVSKPEELGRILVLLMVFSVPIIPIHYLASYFFKSSPATGFAKMCVINIFVGCMPFLISEVIRMPDSAGTDDISKIINWIFSPLPIFCVSRSLKDMAVTSFSLLACDALCEQYIKNEHCTRKMICQRMNVTECCNANPYWTWGEPGIGRYLFVMVCVGIICFVILMIMEYEVHNKIFYRTSTLPPPPVPEQEDSDVLAEREAVKKLTKADIAESSLVVRDLSKYYKKVLAVNRLSFAIKKGECFGLLGVNGAGKTSTFKMLTGDTRISGGDAFVHGLSLKSNIQAVYRCIGYCPQFDGLLDNLTARETLRIYCLIQGIPLEVGESRAKLLANTLGFYKHFNKRVGQCSGGTKRKISSAVALLGDSPLIFLDEPTTGMDPASKRLVWSCISTAVLGGRSVVLTSHSMEECEAMCSRLTIMVQGKMHCLGATQHLKNKFSLGYTLVVKCKPGPELAANLQKVESYVTTTYKEARLMDSYLGISTFYIKDPSLHWWQLFQSMQEARNQIDIEDYSVTQTSLEQVFLSFTHRFSSEDKD